MAEMALIRELWVNFEAKSKLTQHKGLAGPRKEWRAVRAALRGNGCSDAPRKSEMNLLTTLEYSRVPVVLSLAFSFPS